MTDQKSDNSNSKAVDPIQDFHRGVSASMHNKAMDILFEDAPTGDEIESLIELAHVAHWHWVRREDKKPQNISVALWLLSRAYAANGFGERALGYARQSLETIEHENLLPSFYGYCNEAFARAYLLLGEKEKAAVSYATALEISETVPNPQAKEYLLDQINRIEM